MHSKINNIGFLFCHEHLPGISKWWEQVYWFQWFRIVECYWIIDHLEKCGLFSDFQYGFRSSHSTADLLAVVSDRIARAFKRSGFTQAVTLNISKAFDKVWHAGPLHKNKSYGIAGQIFGLISFFVSNISLQVALDRKSSKENLVNAGVPQGYIVGPTLFLLYINDLPDNIICNINICADDTRG